MGKFELGHEFQRQPSVVHDVIVQLQAERTYLSDLDGRLSAIIDMLEAVIPSPVEEGP